MNLLQALIADGDKLRLVVGGSARFGIPLHPTWPQNITFAMTHPVNGPFQLLISVDRVHLHEVVIALDGRKAMLPAVFRIAGRRYQVLQHVVLQLLTLRLMLLQIPHTGHEYMSY